MRALEHEIPRQIEVLNGGGKLVQSTRRWDDAAGVTEEMRTKEHAHDYRYFPDPDLMPFEPAEDWLAEVKSRMVELPLARKQRFMRDYQLPTSDAEVFKSDVELGNYFEGIARQAKNPKAVANWVINNLRAKISESRTGFQPVSDQETEKTETGKMPVLRDLKFKPEAILDLVNLVENKTISSSAAQQVFANPGPAADFKAGKLAAINRIKGHVMKLSKGKANPALVGEILERKLK